MNKVSYQLSLSLMLVTYLIGLAGGYYITPTYQNTMYEKEEMGIGKADRFVDLRYLNAMARHHKGAMDLALQVKDKTKRDEIRTLAENILKDEPVLIMELINWKREWYNDASGVKDPEVPNLGGSDEKTDLRFLNALIAHHLDGIEMTGEIKTKSSRSEVLNNADAVENFLNSTLPVLKQWRQDWYGIN